MGRLKGKVAVVTGGSEGIGLACARRFVEEGAHVYITGRRQSELDQAIEQLGSQATSVQGDVSRMDDLDRLYATIEKAHGHVDIVVANAGLARLEPLGHITEEAYELTYGVNVKGTVFTVQKALPWLTQGSSIILLGSTAGSMGGDAFSIYSSTKAAIRNLARSWALDLKGTGIRVNVLSPGATDTPALAEVARLGGGSSVYDFLITQTPLGRVADPSDVAAVALFLASNDSASMTGSEVFVDGGMAQV